MNELIDKVELLKCEIDNLDLVKEIKKSNKEIMQDKDLLRDIQIYNITKDEKIKERIIHNKEFREYKHKETELNILILDINNRLKEISSKDKCFK